jgi:glutaredoxin-like YruB-family protein
MSLLLCWSLVHAEVYRWVDKNGVVTYKDTPPPPSKKSNRVKVYSDGDFAPAPEPQPVQSRHASAAPTASASRTAAKQPASKRFTGTVEIYVTDWCRYCKQAQSYMTGKGIPFVAYNIEKDSAAAARHKNLGGHGVPLIIIGSNKMSGFSPDALEYYLGNSSR